MLPFHDDRCLLPSPWFNGTLPDPPNDRLHPLDSHRRRSYPWPLLRQCNRRRDRRSHCTHCVRSFTLLLDGCSTSLCGVGQQRLHVQSCPDQANDTIQRWTWVLPSNLSSAFPNGWPKMTCFNDKERLTLSVKSGFWDLPSFLIFLIKQYLDLFFSRFKRFSVLQFCCSFFAQLFGIFSYPQIFPYFVHLVTQTQIYFVERKSLITTSLCIEIENNTSVLIIIRRKALYRNTALTGVNYFVYFDPLWNFVHFWLFYRFYHSSILFFYCRLCSNVIFFPMLIFKFFN